MGSCLYFFFLSAFLTCLLISIPEGPYMVVLERWQDRLLPVCQIMFQLMVTYVIIVDSVLWAVIYPNKDKEGKKELLQFSSINEHVGFTYLFVTKKKTKDVFLSFSYPQPFFSSHTHFSPLSLSVWSSQGLNFILMLVEFILNKIPFEPTHRLFVLAWPLTYIVFAWIYHAIVFGTNWRQNKVIFPFRFASSFTVFLIPLLSFIYDFLYPLLLLPSSFCNFSVSTVLILSIPLPTGLSRMAIFLPRPHYLGSSLLVRWASRINAVHKRRVCLRLSLQVLHHRKLGTIFFCFNVCFFV